MSSATLSWYTGTAMPPMLCTSGEGGVEPRAVVTDDGNRVAPFKAELAQAHGERADFVVELLPRPGLPDAEVLVPDGRAASELFGIADQQLGRGVERTIRARRCCCLAPVEACS